MQKSSEYVLKEFPETSYDGCKDCAFWMPKYAENYPLIMRAKFNLDYRRSICEVDRKRKGSGLSSKRLCGNRPVIIRLVHAATGDPVKPEEVVSHAQRGI